MKILVIAEHNNETVKASTFSTINAASQIDQNIDVLVVCLLYTSPSPRD